MRLYAAARNKNEDGGTASLPVRGEMDPEALKLLQQSRPEPGDKVWAFVTGPRGAREVIGAVTPEGKIPKFELKPGETLKCATTVEALATIHRDQLGL